MRPEQKLIEEEPLILLVEDDPTLRSTLKFNLSREGYLVICAETGSMAVHLVERRGTELSLIILDVMLPEMSGLEVLRRVRLRFDIPVLILSARGEEQDLIDGLELGADDYVVKPFALGELLARVRSVFRRRAIPSARPPAVLHRGDLLLEPDRRRATVHGTELNLRPKEFGLLVALAMEPGRVFSRQELLATVWGNDIVVDERTVDVHISWLRNKLQAAGLQTATIRTVYAAGYRFSLTHAEKIATLNGGDKRPLLDVLV